MFPNCSWLCIMVMKSIMNKVGRERASALKEKFLPRRVFDIQTMICLGLERTMQA